MAELNTAAVDQMPNVSRGGSEIVFASSRGGNMDIWTATFDRLTGLWSSPVPVTAINTPEPESRPSLSGDGPRLYFGRGQQPTCTSAFGSNWTTWMGTTADLRRHR